jgi:hypothetical protein
MASAQSINQNGIRTESRDSSGRHAAKAPAARGGWYSRLVDAWRAVMDFTIPVGYEDENGFHYGDRTETN